MRCRWCPIVSVVSVVVGPIDSSPTVPVVSVDDGLDDEVLLEHRAARLRGTRTDCEQAASSRRVAPNTAVRTGRCFISVPFDRMRSTLVTVVR